MEKTIHELWRVLLTHFKPKPLVIVERFHFHRCNQASGESISDYVVELRQHATHCEFGAYLKEALCDRLVCGTCSESAQKRLLSQTNFSLDKAMDFALSSEAAEKSGQELKGLSSCVLGR